MIDTDKYDNEGIELSDGGTICFPESDGRIERIDEGQEWYELFDTHKALLAEVKRLREQLVRAKKIIHSLAGQSDSAMMDYEDYIEGDEEE